MFSYLLVSVGANKTGFNLKILHFNIRGKLSITYTMRYNYYYSVQTAHPSLTLIPKTRSHLIVIH